MKQNVKKIIKVCVSVFIMILIASSLVYASEADKMPKIDPKIMATYIAPFAVLTLAITTVHAVKMIGRKPALKMIGSSMLIAYVLEEIGVHTGIIYGRYYFTSLMGPKLDVIPIAIICFWTTLIYIGWVVTNLLIDGTPTPTKHKAKAIILKAIIGAMIVGIFDLNADPIAVKNGWWVWMDGGSYFGVPIHNYIGWFIVAFLSYLVHGFQMRREKEQCLEEASVGVRRLSIAPLVVFGLSGISYILINFAGQLGLISFYAFGIPFLIATWKWAEWYKGTLKADTKKEKVLKM